MPRDPFNRDLLERIPLAARTVLDVGCGTGALLAAYRARNPRARLLGIERDPDRADQAAARLDDVAAMDVETHPLPFDPETSLDCVIYSDVLQHLRDPAAVLRAHAAALGPNGSVLICVPNVEHWSFAARLLAGGWDYEATGLFDAGHLRWFTLASMRKLLTEAGLVPYEVTPRVFNPEAASGFAAAVAPALQALGIDPQEYGRRAAPLQFVWRARRQPRERLTLVGNMLAPVGGVSHVRVIQPFAALATDPTVTATVVPVNQLPPAAGSGPHICVLHRPILAGEPGRTLLRHLHAAGWLLVTEFDDHPDFMPTGRPTDALAFTGVHAVQTSTPALAELLRARNAETVLFPNMIQTLPEPRNFAAPDRMTLFFGALNREQDWAPLMPTLNAVAAMAGERLRFEVAHDRPFFDALQTPHKNFTPTCDYDTYLRLLGDSEIALMPLADTPFNRAKSDLKFIEAGACRVAALASPTVYADTIEDGRTGLLFTDADSLRARLMHLIAMPELARALGDAARDYVRRERMLAYQVAPRIAWYRSLWSRRNELHAAVHARVPGLLEAAPAL
ncbi:MAG: methyltransferase domain-containing protein [Rhodospirillales bacterium]|nr:methyltransferase domain-containing protein [Rhodospirillales bacterium]